MKDVACVMIVRFAVAACLLAFARQGVAETNLLVNAQFDDDGLGGALNWRSESVFQIVRDAGPGREPALVFPLRDAAAYVSQPAITLVPGEPYRFGAWIRTQNIGEQNARLLIFNAGWRMSESIYLPGDTQGQWKNVERIFKMMPNGKYNFALYMSEKVKDGRVEIAAPYLYAESERGRRESVQPPPVAPFEARIVPIDPLLSRIDAEDGKMEFFYPGALPDESSNYLFAARIDQGRIASTRLNCKNRATVRFGALAAGSHTMKVKLIRISDLTVVASNDYPVMVVTPREDEKASGRRLNNFVTELVFVRIADGGVEFTMPDDGWASVGFDKINRAAKVHLDDASDPIVQFRENEPMDAMRYLRRGTHRLMVSGSEEGGHLFVRAIRPMVVSPTCERPAFTDKANYQIGFDYYRRYLYHTFNTYSFFGYVPEPDRKHADDVQLHADMVDNGFRTICEVRIPEPSEKWATTDSIRGVVRSFAGWREGLGVLIDETSPYCPRQNNHSLAEFCWQDGMERQSVSLFWNSCLYAMCEDPRGQSSMLSGIANSGGGMGMILPETYLIAYPDRAQMFAQQQHFADFLASIRAQVPCATRSVMLCFSGYITSGGWNGYSAPDVDMKVVIDEFVRNLAINPAFADLGGIAFYAIGCHEEMFRWYMDTIRHYAILGKTDSRAEEFGYRLHPGHIVNNDFSDDGRSWRIDAAEHGSIVPWYRKDYGRFVQARKMVPSGYGDTAMLMTRSKVAPNKISQIMTKLEPGRLYLASCCTVDVDDLDNPGPGGNDMTFRILVDNGASEIPGLAITHRSPWNRQPDGRDRWSRMPTPLIVTHSTVFRADSTTARLTLTDWGKDDDPVGRIGQRRAMNYVIVRPYYEEKPIGVIDVEQEDK